MLALENICKSFGDKLVLDNISLDVKKGEIISLLGQSGSGKSTLLNIIAGFEKSDEGMMTYKDKVLFSDTYFCEPEHRNIGFVFQNYALFPHLSVEKNICFGISKESKSFQSSKVKELLELMAMQGMKKKYPQQLSGGEQQRIAIARVLARQSSLILFDEAFSSIDAGLKLKLITQIKEILKSQHKTAIFVTHDPREAIFLSDRIAFIEEGKIIQYDSAKNLHKNPASKAIENLFGSDSFTFKSIDEITA